MLQNATKRELLEQLIVAELISKRGQGPLARRHFPMAGRGPTSGVRAVATREVSAESGVDDISTDLTKPDEPR